MKKLITLIIILTLNTSCAEKKTIKITEIKHEVESSIKTNSLKFTSSIRSIFQDSQGNYWFGSSNEGVCLFDGKSFTYFGVYNGLSHDQVLSIQEDNLGRIWFGTHNGVSSFDGETMTNHTQSIIKDSLQKWEKTKQDLWFSAGIKEGVYRYDGQKLVYLAFPNPKDTNPNSVFAVTGLSKGKNNKIWIGTYAGVFGYDGIDFTIINDETLGFNIETKPLHIRSILEDSQGRLWIGNNGIGVLVKEDDTIFNFSEKQNLIHSESSGRGDKSPPGTLEHVFTITEDSQGNIWFGDRDAGIWKYDGKTMKNFTTKDGLTNDFAQSIYEDNYGEMWFGMADGNVFKFNGNTFEKQF